MRLSTYKTKSTPIAAGSRVYTRQIPAASTKTLRRGRSTSGSSRRSARKASSGPPRRPRAYTLGGESSMWTRPVKVGGGWFLLIGVAKCKERGACRTHLRATLQYTTIPGTHQTHTHTHTHNYSKHNEQPTSQHTAKHRTQQQLPQQQTESRLRYGQGRLSYVKSLRGVLGIGNPWMILVRAVLNHRVKVATITMSCWETVMLPFCTEID